MIIDGMHEKELFTENCPFRVVMNISENFVYPLHWHNAVEIIYALENGYDITVNNMEYHLDEKEILIVAAGDVHGFNTRNNSGKRVFVQFNMLPFEGLGNLNIIKPFVSKTRKIQLCSLKYLHSELESQILRMIAEYEKKDFAYELFLNARLYDILVVLSRNIINDSLIKEPQDHIKRVYGLEKINRAFKYIEENYHLDISLKDVSKAAGFSEFHFSRIFKDITEKSFLNYLNEYRINKAEKLLMNTDTTVTQAAFASGFNSVVTFNRLFKKIKGCTPSDFKKLYC
ncbi:MAG: AraC family transcriptional regulator [Clostridia bacterium]|nr:AraC family transcriptional regulator [Clostridia bacterium]